MTDVIVYQAADRLEIVYPSPSASSIEEVAALSVPPGAAYRIVSADALPAQSAYRSAWQANFDDEPCVVSVDPVKKAAVDKAMALEALDVWFSSAIAEGFVTEYGWTLGMTDSDVALLTGNYVLAQSAAAANQPLPAVIDRKGVPHAIPTIADLTTLMLNYGTYRASLSAEYAERKAALEE